MKNPFALSFHSVLEWFRSPRNQSRARLSRAKSRDQQAVTTLTAEQVRAMLQEMLSDPETARLLLKPLVGTVFPIQGGMPTGTPSRIAKFNSAGDDVVETATPIFEKDGNKIGIGTADPGAKLEVRQTSAATSGTPFNTLSFLIAQPNVQPPQASTASYIALSGVAYSVSTPDLSDGFALRGCYGKADHGGQGTVTGAVGVQGWVVNSGSGSITNAYCVYAQAPYVTAGSIANKYGVYIESISGGTASNYALYAAGGTSYFGGNVQIGTPSDTLPSQWKTLLFGASAPRQVNYGPEMITAVGPVPTGPDPDKRRVVLWGGKGDDTEAQFLISSTGWLEWGAGGSSDQDSSLKRGPGSWRNADMQLITDRAFVIVRETTGQERLRFDMQPAVAEANQGTLNIKSTSADVPTIRLEQSAAAAPIFGGFVTNDSKRRFEIDASGKQFWGTGSANPDISLARFEGGSPSTKGLQLVVGDLYISDAGKGIILKSPDGQTCKRLRIDNSGNIAWDSVTCP